MQQIEATQPEASSLARGTTIPRRWTLLAACLLLLILLAILPPLISVNRYQRRIATGISTSLGRPVHFDHVSLNLLPIPGFTITNFVVEEDPAFGAEPIIRANTVHANLRVSSIFRRPIEVSRISFTDPSINLVHDARGRWNFEGLLLQAAHIETAPTAQQTPGRTPRFPYIEATGARFNLKQGYEKTPFSLSEADFALWLPDPQTWKVRLRARPIRTDTSVSDTGLLQVEGTLGRAASLESVPLQMEASWRGAPLGEASRLLLAHDLGMRGEVTLSATVRGNLSSNALQTNLQIEGLRRSDFVPEQMLSLHVECTGNATRAFHAIADLRCSWPVPDSNGATVALAGSIPDTLHPASADLQLGVSPLPLGVLLNWLRVASTRMPPGLSAKGLLSGSISHDPTEASAWVGQLAIPDLEISGAKLGSGPLAVTDILLHSAPPASDSSRRRTLLATPIPRLLLSPVDLPLGGEDPATLEGSVDGDGYDLHLSGMVLLSRLLALGASVPQFGDGLLKVLPVTRGPSPIHLDLSAHRTWGGDQIWTDNLLHPEPAPSHRSRRASGGGHRSPLPRTPARLSLSP